MNLRKGLVYRALDTKKHVLAFTGTCFKMVAGVGFEPTTFRL